MRPTRRSCKALCALALALGLLAGCGKDPAMEKHEKQLFAMDTVMLLTAYGDRYEAALDAAVDTINGLAADLDPEKEGGSLYALNAEAGGPVIVSADCAAVLDTAMDVWSETGGALDPALYPVIKAWGFTTGEYRVPDQGSLDALLAGKDTGAIAISGDTVTMPAGMELSLGAVAKGYAAQKTLGETRPDGKSWQVAVTDPSDTGAYVGTLSVGQTAVVTSGGYQRYFDEDGVRYIHILDPATGRPADNDLLSVTVVTADGARADALSTALFVLGSEGALDYAAAHGDVEAVLITKDGRVIVTGGLRDGFTEAGKGYTYEYE